MDHIVPAISTKDKETQLSSSELQKLLHDWFNDKGLLTDLRCYLRRQMIEILRNTTVGKSIMKTPSKTSTLTGQAVNLIVAEYLIRNQCHYSLSMFSSEVSLTSNLPEFVNIFDSSSMSQNWQFSVENLLNILELNGITKQSKLCEKIISLYYDCKGNHSLINALIKALGEFSNNTFNNTIGEVQQPELYDKKMDSGDAATIRMLKTMLCSTNLSSQIVNQIVGKISHQYNLAAMQKEDDIKTVIEALKLDIEERDAKINELKEINENLKKKIIKKIGENKELKNNLQSLLVGEKLLQKEYKKLRKLTDVTKMDQETQHGDVIQMENKSVLVVSAEKSDCLLDHCNEMCKEALRVIEHLKKENLDLAKESNDQKNEIISLSSKCNQLLDNFNACQSRLTFLNKKITQKKVSYCQSEVASECSTSEGDSKADDSSSAESLTDDVLYRARLKLKMLEKETDEINKRMKVNKLC